MYKHLQWLRFNLPSCSLQLSAFRVTKAETKHFSATTASHHAEMNLQEGSRERWLESLQRSSVKVCHWPVRVACFLSWSARGISHRCPVHADAVHAGVVGVSPVGRHLQLHDLEGPLGSLLCAVTTHRAVGPPSAGWPRPAVAAAGSFTTHRDSERLQGLSVLLVGERPQQLAGLFAHILQTLETLKAIRTVRRWCGSGQQRSTLYIFILIFFFKEEKKRGKREKGQNKKKRKKKRCHLT